MKKLIVGLSLILFLPLAAWAQDHLITQKDLKFSVPIKVVKPGDRIVFSNEDDVIHNITSITDWFKFDLGALKPGMKKSVEFTEKGVVDVDCTIHPGMKLTVFVF